MNPFRRLCIGSFLLVSPFAFACASRDPRAPTAPPCAVQGEPVQWSALVCMFREGTDDFEAPQVRSCMDTHAARISGGACAFVVDAKRELCGRLVDGGGYDGDVDRCFADPTLVPRHDGPMLTLRAPASGP